MEKARQQEQLRNYEKTNSIIFVLLLIATGLLFFLLPKDKVSVQERRALSPVPKFNSATVKNGKFADSLDFYYSDNFIFRNWLIILANNLKLFRGMKNEQIQFYTKAGPEKHGEINKMNENNIKDKLKRPGVDTAATRESADVTNEDFENIKSVIVYKKRAIQIFGGLTRSATNYAAMIKRYKETLGPGVHIYCMPIPVGSDFYLPLKYSKDNTKEKKYIELLYSDLDPAVTPVRAYDELDIHKGEYIQFNTDHHWTGRGAYYGYTAFCKAAGMAAVPMTSMTRGVIPGFVGTMYNYTMSEDLKENADSVEYFRIPGQTKTTYFKKGIDNGQTTKMLEEHVRGGDSYGVFLGADFPLMRIVSDNKNGRKIAVLKDSYGNPFATLLPANFEEVFVIDYRYFNGNIKQLVEKYGITDLVFAHNVFVMNADFTISRESLMLGKRSG